MKILKNKNGQIRSGFKIVFLIVIKMQLDILFFQLFGIINKKIMNSNWTVLKHPALIQDISSAIYSVIINGVIIFIIVMLWRFIEKKKISQMGLPNIKNYYKELIIGVFVGIFAISLVECTLLISKTVQISEPAFKQSLLWLIGRGLIITIFIVVASEMLYRGYIMSLLKNTNKYLILGISVLVEVFPLLLMNKFNLLVFINGILLSLLLAYMFMKSKNIWMPIGFDFSWHFLQIYIYGFRDKGVDGAGVYQLQHIKNNLLNGGAFGPQAGIVVTGIICLVFAFVYLYYKDNKIDEFMVED